ncbi:sprT-like family protein [Microcystis phage Mel-JY33]
MTTLFKNYSHASKETYDAIDEAFMFFNAELFESRLPHPFFTLQRKKGAHGYFWAEQYQNRGKTETAHEIALNPLTMCRDTKTVLSTLVHEMVHLEQQEYGTPGKGGNHNKEWGEFMDRIGLTPTSTGQPGGKRTGRKVTHMIVEGGPFDVACDKLLSLGYSLHWHATEQQLKAKPKDLSKVKHTCPCCGQNAWGKLGIRIVCGDCEEMMEAAQ